MLNSILGASWRSSVLGIITGVTLLLGEIKTLIDSDPLTNPQYAIIAAAVTGIWMSLQIRDNVVADEQAGTTSRKR